MVHAGRGAIDDHDGVERGMARWAGFDGASSAAAGPPSREAPTSVSSSSRHLSQNVLRESKVNKGSSMV